MYICKDSLCDPCCDFCWYCVHGEFGEPVKCERNEDGFGDGLGYCDNFKCRLHETKPQGSKKIIKKFMKSNDK